MPYRGLSSGTHKKLMEEKIHEFFFAITEEEHVEVATE